MAITRNYTSLYSIKDFAINELAPKYFNKDEVNDLDIGLLGYTTELIGNTIEDSFNTTTTYINEMFPHLAVLPETIYNWGSLFQLNTSFGTAADCEMAILIPEDEIIKYGTRVKEVNTASTISDNLYEFIVDSETIINVEDKQFMPDYDIKINYRPYKDDYIFTARFSTNRLGSVYKNSISDIINPYIVTKRIVYEGIKYLILRVKCHQVTKFYLEETIITNDSINASTFEIEFDDKLAGINVFYKAPGDINYTQMEARMSGTSPLKIPFYYYKRTDDKRLIISFSTRDNYFQPKYNSDIRIEYYTTTGDAGNFPEYTGNDVVITTTSETYEYNTSITIIGFPVSGSSNGANELSLSELQQIIIKNFSTVDSFTIENDLQQYFTYINSPNSDCNIIVIKKRDDIFERLFTLFFLCKNSLGDIYHTNTLIVNHDKDDYDLELTQSNTYIIKPGHIYTYDGDSLDNAVMLCDETIETARALDDEFKYVNPFLIYFSKSPAIIGYYLNTVDEKYVLDYTYVNEMSLVQFICNTIHIERNAIMGEDDYTVTVVVTPTIDTLETPIVSEITDDLTGETTITVHNNLKVRLAVEEGGTDTAYIELSLDSWNLDENTYTFVGKLHTDDTITRASKMKITNFISTETGEELPSKLIPMDECVFNIYTYYRYDESNENYTHTNTYSTKTFPVTLILPLQLMRSTTCYLPKGDLEIDEETGEIYNDYYTKVQSYPLIALDIVETPELTKEFYTMFKKQYTKAKDIIHKLTNNFSMDLKFVNTYGRSKNFTIGDDGAMLLDKVNVKLHIQVKSVYGTIEEDLFRDIRIFIKDYIESVNMSSGNNSIYISNLIQALENKFADLSYMKFISINDYDSSIQVIDNRTVNLDLLTKEERINYVPEYLTIGTSDIIIDSI